MYNRKCVTFTEFISFWFIFGCVSAQWAIEDDGCRTPDRGVGDCIVIRDCQPILTFLSEAPKPLSQQVIARLRSYQCGFEGTQVKVCCPSTPLPVDSTIPKPPDTSRHRNLRLINGNCGLSDIPNKITNGEATDLFEFPWMALLQYDTPKGPDFRCGGSIINSRYILTAAHCIKYLRNPLIAVRIGEHDTREEVDCIDYPTGKVCSPPYQDLGIQSAIAHPSYNRSSFQNDIGLIRTSSPMNLSVDNAKPICLPTGKWRTYNLDNTNVIVTGWGATETGRTSHELLKVEIPTTTNTNCQKTYEGIAQISYRQLCAGGKDGRDSCAGDSGGPLHFLGSEGVDLMYIQFGTVSFGPRLCGRIGNPGVYTRVSYYMDWILDNIKP